MAPRGINLTKDTVKGLQGGLPMATFPWFQGSPCEIGLPPNPNLPALGCLSLAGTFWKAQGPVEQKHPDRPTSWDSGLSMHPPPTHLWGKQETKESLSSWGPQRSQFLMRTVLHSHVSCLQHRWTGLALLSLESQVGQRGQGFIPFTSLQEASPSHPLG